MVNYQRMETELLITEYKKLRDQMGATDIAMMTAIIAEISNRNLWTNEKGEVIAKPVENNLPNAPVFGKRTEIPMPKINEQGFLGKFFRGFK